MPEKIVALLSSRRNIRRVLKKIKNERSEKTQLLVIAVGVDMHSFDTLPYYCRIVNFFDYTPKNYEETTLTKFGRVADKWHRVNGFQQEIVVCGINMGEPSRYYFLTKVLQRKIHILLTLQEVLRKESPSLIYADARFIPYLSVLGRTFCRIGRAGKAEAFSALSFAVLGFCAILYKLFYKTLAAKLINFLNRAKMKSINTIFLGTGHMMRNFASFMEKGIPEKNKGIFKSLNCEIFKIFHKPRAECNGGIYFEGLMKGREITKSFTHVVRLLRQFYLLRKTGGFRDAFVVSGLDIYELLEEDFVRFFAQNITDAVKSVYLARNIVKCCRPSRVFFAWANWWGFSVMNKVLQNEGVTTLSYNHGLVQEVIPHCSGVDIMLCSGEYDRALLEKFSGSREYVTIGHTAGNGPKFRDKTSGAGNILLLSSVMPENFGVAADTSRGIARNHFIRETLRFIDERPARLDFDKIVIKLHPMEKASGIKSVLKEFPGLEPRVCVTKRDLYKHIVDAKVIFSLVSTVILDCLDYDKQFFICDGCSFLNRGVCFYDVIADVVKYHNASELSQKYEMRIRQVGLNEKIRTLYYGSRVLDSAMLLKNYLV